MVDCKQYTRKEDCDTLNANCQWKGSRGCIRRNGVNAGKRYKYDSNGKVVEITDGDSSQDIQVVTDAMENLNIVPQSIVPQSIAPELDFEYDPELDQPRPELQQKELFSGTYGITFIPAFSCVNGQRFLNSVGKVFWDESSANDEWELSKKLQTIEKGTTQKYFTYPKFQCHIPFKCPKNGTPMNKLTQPEKALLKYYDKSTRATKPATLVQQVMDYSGIMLGAYFDEYYNNDCSRAEFIHVIENLFYGVKRLIDNGYVHCDLKEPNIIISNKRRLRIIDFGLTIPVERFYYPSDNTLLSVKYTFVAAPELTTYLDMKNNKKESYSGFVGDFDRYVGNGEKWYRYFTGNETINQQQYEHMLNEINTDALAFCTNANVAKKQDPYSIGLIIMRLVANRAILKPSADDDPGCVLLFKKLMKGLLEVNPENRFDIYQAIDLVKQIKAFPHPDPFKKNKDSSEMNTIFSAFGKRRDTELSYLKKFI
jgi:hypothetical protein